MRLAIVCAATALLATAASAQRDPERPTAPRAGALTLYESSASSTPIPAKKNQLIDIYLNTEPGMEWKITTANMVKVDGIIAPTFASDRTAPGSAGATPAGATPAPTGGPRRYAGRAQTVVRIQLSDMSGYWGVTLGYDKIGSREAKPVKTAAYKFVI